MKKSVKLKIEGNDELVVNYDESSMITLQISYNPHYMKTKSHEYSYWVHGFEWGDKSYSLEFKRSEIKERQKIEIEFGLDDKATIKPHKKEVLDEAYCSFCQKKSSEVDLLIKKIPFTVFVMNALSNV
jgi:hypothetical protein